MRSFVTYRTFHIGDDFTYHATTGLEDLPTSGSLHDSLSLSKSVGWPILRFSPDLISCPSRISLGTGPVLDFMIFRTIICHLFADVLFFYVLYRIINSLIGCKILQDDLNSLEQCNRLIGK